MIPIVLFSSQVQYACRSHSGISIYHIKDKESMLIEKSVHYSSTYFSCTICSGTSNASHCRAWKPIRLLKGDSKDHEQLNCFMIAIIKHPNRFRIICKIVDLVEHTNTHKTCVLRLGNLKTKCSPSVNHVLIIFQVQRQRKY